MERQNLALTDVDAESTVAASGAPRVSLQVGCRDFRDPPDWGDPGGGVNYRDYADPSVGSAGFPESSAAQVEGVGPNRRSGNQEPGSSNGSWPSDAQR
ncbi:hypothetical protein ON010_g17960 [Phytophthora cinnamomi]|nr:hypothetical protein ON010_g17960 [Phytophthora cinnamomi]